MVEIAQKQDVLLADVARTETPPGCGAFWWLGQHTFIVKAGGHVFYLDPWFAPWESRQTRTLLLPESPHRVDFALVSHGHEDHLCPESLRGIAQASPETLFICPRTEAQRMLTEAGIPESRLRPLNAGETLEHQGVRITAIKSKHETFDERPQLGFPYLGYVVEAGGVTFYHAGDTILYDGLLGTLQRWPHFDALFLPINGRDAERYLRGCLGNFTFQEAAELAGELRPGLAVPSHYDMFIGNQEDPSKFVRFLEAKFPGVRSWVGKAGERVWIGRCA
ncbi:MAG TPA: MBL fold metallo-hydrolase [Chthonomonadaceae bacterium]|nr:MBL fold metallo-hydrolase [Chthonomonadaceae bacterium]